MPPTRQARKSCEGYRARKLRCSGEKSGCSHCQRMSLPCRFQTQGAPGRPRKRARQPNGQDHRDSLPITQEGPGSLYPTNFSTPRQQPAFSTPEAIPSFPVERIAENACALDPIGPPRAMLADSGAICSVPMSELQFWHPSPADRLQNYDLGMIPPSIDWDASVSALLLPPPSCRCDDEVSGIARHLNRTSTSHAILPTLRSGASLVDKLLLCPICYDLSKPPRETVRNVVLLGHLLFAITSGYQKYLRWLQQQQQQSGDLDSGETTPSRRPHTIYLDSGISELEFHISGERLRELIVHGLQADAARLRQRNRHMVGHEDCLADDAEGRCRRNENEDAGNGRDSLDLCPLNPVARKLVPCFCIVDQVQVLIQQVADAVG
ncbi:hypothetical protein BO78DRAFT_449105 [Aspergillus sclerotiicarbonarius CBS 121057]|uniref:Uncharacterized protein n=1 Tax=Aspergillus sclerotiicarbonarius (strain CBS 121057 / IBT 28362) TaxID=1448318 RepID=A0A319ETU8_ASPSB|nr:hypothetical protein BO78DRAFT_449105 [Aspergillus sclerotiicarbonarius CBS 121057]